MLAGPMHDSSREPPLGAARAPAPHSIAREVVAVASGGMIGASLRFAVAIAAESAGLHSAIGTGIANVTGSFLLGALLARFDAPSAHPLYRPFWVIGVFGSYTTFSTLALDNRLLAGGHGELLALVHLIGSMSLGLAAFALGYRMRGGRR